MRRLDAELGPVGFWQTEGNGPTDRDCQNFRMLAGVSRSRSGRQKVFPEGVVGVEPELKSCGLTDLLGDRSVGLLTLHPTWPTNLKIIPVPRGE